MNTSCSLQIFCKKQFLHPKVFTMPKANLTRRSVESFLLRQKMISCSIEQVQDDLGGLVVVNHVNCCMSFISLSLKISFPEFHPLF